MCVRVCVCVCVSVVGPCEQQGSKGSSQTDMDQTAPPNTAEQGRTHVKRPTSMALSTVCCAIKRNVVHLPPAMVIKFESET